MRTISVRGIEIIDDESVPNGEIWLQCPLPNGGKVRYMFSLTDHRMLQEGNEGGSFFSKLRSWVADAHKDMLATRYMVAEARVHLILAAMDDFLQGKPVSETFETISEEENNEGVEKD